MKKLIFRKEYNGYESLSDVDRDISEAFDGKFNEAAKDIPSDFEGVITITIEYSPEFPKVELA